MASIRSLLISTVLLVLLFQFTSTRGAAAAAASDDDWGMDDWGDDDDSGHDHLHHKSEDDHNQHQGHDDKVQEPPAAAAAAAAPPPAPAPPAAAASIAHDEDHGSPQFAAQQSGGNFASYNESCVQPGGNGKQCISARGLVCTGGLCKCGTNPTDSGIPLVYVDNRDVQNCEPVSHARNRWACSWDDQCRLGKYGYYSRCSSGRCSCYDTDGRGRQIKEYENTCFLQKAIGDSCEDDLQCNVTIPGEAICFGSRSIGTCQCSNGYFEYTWPPGSTGSGKPNECLEVRTINQTCIADAQCRHNDGLGPLARCDEGLCSCYDTENSFQKLNVSYYIPKPNPHNIKGQCYFLKGANETCTSNEECILGYHSLAVCLPHASYNGEHVCQCSAQDERKCNSGSQLLVSWFVTFVVALALVGVSMFHSS